MRPSDVLRVACAAIGVVALSACRTVPTTPVTTSAAPLQVFAAGSLREALTEIAQRYQADTGTPVQLTFGASGLLRQRIEAGEPAEVFASADTQHPATLAAGSGKSGAWQPPTRFVRNQLCAIAQPALQATPDTLLPLMLSPRVKLGTSTPKFDPAGDYAWALFRRAGAVRPGAYAALDAKALQLTGSPEALPPPAGQGAYSWLMDTGQADLFLTYCTNAMAVVRDVPRMQQVALPASLQVGADYSVTSRAVGMNSANAQRFVQHLLTPSAQASFARFGFGAP